jgi:hypothetical protein
MYWALRFFFSCTLIYFYVLVALRFFFSCMLIYFYVLVALRADFDACANSISFFFNLFLAPLSESIRNKIVPNKSDRDLLLCASLR